jgi:polar amino acid transport system substrate-binding protein
VRKALLALVLLIGLVGAAGCGGDDGNGETGAAGQPTATAEDACAKESLETVNEGQLTVGTDNPAFPPWFEGEGEFEPWDPTTDPTKKGYEAEVAYAIAGELGFSDDEVRWTVVPFEQSFRPGPKDFDFDINQISYSDERAQSVDFSESYYDVEQAVVALEGNPIAEETTVEALSQYKLGAQIGTTSLNMINDVIQPDEEPSVYNTNNDAISALNAKQVDGIVVDFPTGLYMAAVQLDGGTVVGRLPTPEGGEYFGLVFERDSPLVDCVNEALATLRENGTLEALEEEWLGGSAPVLE